MEAEPTPAAESSTSEFTRLLEYLKASRGFDFGAYKVSTLRPIHLLISDVVMPGMSGSELAARLEAERPGLRVLYISGYPEDAIARHGVLHAGRSFLQKPFPPGVLLQTVREILDQGDRWPIATSS